MPRTRSLAWSQLKVGLVAVAALVLTGVFIFFVGGQGGFAWQQYHLKTRFSDVQGLKTGAVVRVAGVEVGTVRKVEFVGSQVEVVMRVANKMQRMITDQSRASIGSLSLLGAPVIDISPSAAGTPIRNWGYVPSTRPYGQLSSVAEGATRSLDEATKLLQDLRRGRGTIGKLFTDDKLYRDLSVFVDSAEQMVTALNAGQGTLGKLLKDDEAYRSLRASLDNLSAVTERLSRGEGSLGRLLHDEQFASELTTTTSNLKEVTARINKGDGTLGKLSTDATLFNRVNSLSDRLDTLVEGLNKGDGTMGRLLQDRQLYENMNGAVTELRSLISDVRRDPKRYLNVRVSLF
jgi:phospholipid/cholesterol/gamma-HCH transport system substrate-binding protein